MVLALWILWMAAPAPPEGVSKSGIWPWRPCLPCSTSSVLRGDAGEAAFTTSPPVHRRCGLGLATHLTPCDGTRWVFGLDWSSRWETFRSEKHGLAPTSGTDSQPGLVARPAARTWTRGRVEAPAQPDHSTPGHRYARTGLVCAGPRPPHGAAPLEPLAAVGLGSLLQAGALVATSRFLSGTVFALYRRSLLADQCHVDGTSQHWWASSSTAHGTPASGGTPPAPLHDVVAELPRVPASCGLPSAIRPRTTAAAAIVNRPCMLSLDRETPAAWVVACLPECRKLHQHRQPGCGAL